jgi:hypothetical protein
MGSLKITPLDPNSPKGREVAERLTETLADIRLAIAERERAVARQGDAERGAA